jgi:phosphoserine phosphatase RsbU/P
MVDPPHAIGSEERLELLVQLSQTFNSSLDLDEVLNRVIDEVIKVMKAERGILMLIDEEARLEFRTARGLDQRTIEDPEFQISKGIVERVARDGTSLLTSDAQLDSRFSSRQSVLSLGLRSILCVPLLFKERRVGVIYVDNRLQAGIFTQEDLTLLEAIAANASIAVENARLYQIAVEKGRMERELQMAYDVQASLLPRALPSLYGWEFAARWKPARQVAGDYYDLIQDEDGSLNLIIGDVTDKGLPASLFMVFTRSVLRASSGAAISLEETVRRSNRLLCLESDQGLFVTLVLARLDPMLGTLCYVNAGHNPPLIYRSSANAFEHLIRTGIPLGIDDLTDYEEKSIRLEVGDLLVLYTDGIPEAINGLGEQFGMDRFSRVISDRKDESAEHIVEAVLDSMDRFSGQATSFDDVTILVVKRQL